MWRYKDNAGPKQSGINSKMWIHAAVANPYFCVFLICLALTKGYGEV